MIRARRTRETGIPADDGGACRGDSAANGVDTAAVLVGMRDIGAAESTPSDLLATGAAADPGDAVVTDAVTDVRCVAAGMLATDGLSMGAALALAETTTLDR